MSGRSALLCSILVAATLAGQTPGEISVKDFGAKGDGVKDDTAAMQAAFDAACQGFGSLYVPGGTYNISAPLIPNCALRIRGAGTARSILFQTVAKSLNHGIMTVWPLSLQDLSIRTDPLAANYAMAAVERPGKGTAAGESFTFTRVNSSGFNFGILISGTGDTDLVGSVTVQHCNLSVDTAAGAVSQPVNVANAASLVVENSTLTGDTNNDHALYLIAVRNIVIRDNLISGHGNSAIKMLTGGFHSLACPALNHDYTGWSVEQNTITHSALALAAYTYCGIELPELTIADNRIVDIADTYAGDAAAIYIQANCQSVMRKVTQSGNVFQNISLSGVYLLSSVQGGPPCPDPAAEGIIASFTSTGETYRNWSISYPGSYYAISSQARSRSKLQRVAISKLSADGQGNGRAGLNLSAFDEVSVDGKTETNRKDPLEPAR